jgi:hypothetical protein
MKNSLKIHLFSILVALVSVGCIGEYSSYYEVEEIFKYSFTDTTVPIPPHYNSSSSKDKEMSSEELSSSSSIEEVVIDPDVNIHCPDSDAASWFESRKLNVPRNMQEFVILHKVPSDRVQAQHYLPPEFGAPFHENTPNIVHVGENPVATHSYRPDGHGVNLEFVTDVNEGGANQIALAFFDSGERLSYAIYAERAGTYTIRMRNNAPHRDVRIPQNFQILNFCDMRKVEQRFGIPAIVTSDLSDASVASGPNAGPNKWNKWTFSEVDVELKKGYYIFVVIRPEGSLNINFFDFVFKQ